LYPVLISLIKWGDRWMAGADGPPLEIVHRPCGHAMMPDMVCPHCREPVVARDTEAHPRAARQQLATTNETESGRDIGI
jgi:hypothetical protein